MIKVVKSFAITLSTVSLYKRHHFVGETTNAQARWKYSKSISTSDQYVTLQKYFLHLSLVIWFFPTPPIKLKLVLQIGGRLLIANHLDKSLLLTNQNRGATIISYLLYSSLGSMPFTKLHKLHENTGPKTFWLR